MSRPLLDSLPEIRERVVHAPHRLLCLDFDGTLARIEQHPAQASLSPALKRLLQNLTDEARTTVAIISGRERSDLSKRVSIPGAIYAGNHGLEISGPGFIFIEPTAAAAREALQQLADRLARRLEPIPGALAEDKGLTVSVHYRQTPSEMWEEVRQTVHAALAGSQHPFQLAAGDMIFDIRPRVYWNKSNAVGWIKEQLGHADALTIYVGDDTSDEDAFATLTDGITVKVGAAEETAAQFYLESQADVPGFLEWLVELPKSQILNSKS